MEEADSWFYNPVFHHHESGQSHPMPTYEYVCKNCGDNFEIFQSFSDKPLKKHKECGGDLQKVFHARGIVFKGGGFYATDSRPASSTKDTKGRNGKTDIDKKDKKEKKSSAKAASSSSSAPDSD
jgi:putative FmdB family regulatory protein